jgi:ribonuclease D
VRDEAAARLDLDPGVLCSRDRLEAVARRNPATLEDLAEVPEVRRWQVDVLGADFLRALAPHRRAVAPANPAAESPYRVE